MKCLLQAKQTSEMEQKLCDRRNEPAKQNENVFTKKRVSMQSKYFKQFETNFSAVPEIQKKIQPADVDLDFVFQCIIFIRRLGPQQKNNPTIRERRTLNFNYKQYFKATIISH
jgi:hypothetical protein